MLREYIITPDVLLGSSYEHPALYRLALQQIWEEAQKLGLLRNLAAGEWESFLNREHQSPRDDIGMKLLKAVRMRRRLVDAPKHSQDPLVSENGWRQEALNSHRKRKKARGLIFTDSGKRSQKDNPIIASILRLDEHEWWSNRSDSISVRRTLDEVKRSLSPFFGHSRRIAFVDPYLSPDPEMVGYMDFPKLLSCVKDSCHIALHTVVERAPSAAVETQFQRWADQSNRSFEVVMRDKFAFTNPMVPAHDRYLISDLAVVASTNGFDFGGQKTPSMTLSLVGDDQARQVIEFYDRNYGASRILHWKFHPVGHAK